MQDLPVVREAVCGNEDGSWGGLLPDLQSIS